MSSVPHNEADVNSARAFLQAVHGAAVGCDRLISIWSKPDLAVRFFANIDEAAEYGLNQAASGDVYFGVALYRAGITSGRGTCEDVTAVTCLVADIDFAIPGAHRTANLPLGWSDAQRIFLALGILPSFVVSTGYGIHVYVLVDKPWLIPSGADRRAAADFLRSWGLVVQTVASAMGWQIDSVFDLARVLRVPGTVNRKHGTCKPVHVILPSGPFPVPPVRYSREHIDQRLRVLSVPADCAEISRPRPELLPWEATQLLKKAAGARNGAKFSKLWSGDWSDYGSQSEADLALCGILAFWLGPDPELISRALRASGLYRPKWDQPHFADGRTYGQSTVQKALTGRTVFYQRRGLGGRR